MSRKLGCACTGTSKCAFHAIESGETTMEAILASTMLPEEKEAHRLEVVRREALGAMPVTRQEFLDAIRLIHSEVHRDFARRWKLT